MPCSVGHCATPAAPLVKLKEPGTPLASRKGLACRVQPGWFGEPGALHAAAPCQPCSEPSSHCCYRASPRWSVSREGALDPHWSRHTGLCILLLDVASP